MQTMLNPIDKLHLSGRYTLSSLVPEAKDLVKLSAEELGRHLLFLARLNLNGSSLFLPSNVVTSNGLPGDIAEPLPEDAPKYDKGDAGEVILACQEGWNWLRLGGYIMPAPGVNATAGWMMLTKKGVEESASREARPVGSPPAAAPSGPPKAGK